MTVIRVREYGSVKVAPGLVTVCGDGSQLYAWANRPGMRWPCSDLATHDRVAATIDGKNGDLIELLVIHDGRDYEAPDLTGDELTAWIDDNLKGTPFSHLAKTATGMGG